MARQNVGAPPSRAADEPTKAYVDAQVNAVSAVLSSNMILDPSFENVAYWANAFGVMDPTVKRDGTQSRKITATGAGYLTDHLVLTHDALGNPSAIISAQDSNYQFECYLSKGSSNGTAGGLRMQVYSFSGYGGTGTRTLEDSILVPNSALTTTPSYFQMLSYIGNANAQSASIEIGINPSTTVGDTFNVDAVYVVDLSWYDVYFQMPNKQLGPNISFAPETQAYQRGGLFYDQVNECLTFYNADSNVSMQIGQESWVRVLNNSGASIANGTPVYASGYDATSGFPTIAPANANGATTSDVMGFTTETIASGASGWVTWCGVVHNVNTSAFAAGSTLYLSTTAGALTTTAPAAPNQVIRVGKCLASNATTGAILALPGVSLAGYNGVQVLNAGGGYALLGTNQIRDSGAISAPGATPAINTDVYDQYNFTAVATNITSMTTNLIGSPLNGQKLMIRITTTAAITMAWGSKFLSSGVAALPTSYATGKTYMHGFIYDSVKAAWMLMAVDATGY